MVTSMLEKAIEIEGLLRIIRDGNPLPETYILLNMKAAELAEQAETLEEQSTTSASEPPHADFVMTAPATPPPAAPEVVFNIEHPESDDESAARTIDALTDLGEDDADNTPEDLALIEEDDILLSFEESTEFHPQAATTPSDLHFDMEEETPDSSPEDETTPQAQEENQPEKNQLEEDTHENKATEEKSDASVPANPQRKAKLRASFSLNDRFLYARELFNGNMKMFDSTLDFLEGIEDYSIIEDYFYSELEWDPENSHVAAFMDILRPNFRE
ncbi:MAG: hypothetical protein K2L11_10985 [Muribaculaceae bacterium]|nr:hypothetical protein [Muribaculaceae bacterium]